MISSTTPEGCLMGVRPYRRDAAADPLSASADAAWAAFACPGLVARVTRSKEKARQQPVSPFSLILTGVAWVTRVTRVIPTPPVLGPRRKKKFEYLRPHATRANARKQGLFRKVHPCHGYGLAGGRRIAEAGLSAQPKAAKPPQAP